MESHIANGTRQRMVSEHPLHVEVFDGHRLVLAAELHGQLMQGIVPHILDTPM
jgi:hypothetical protein